MVSGGGKKWDLERVLSSLETKDIVLASKTISVPVLPLCYVKELDTSYYATPYKRSLRKNAIIDDIPISFTVKGGEPLCIARDSPFLERSDTLVDTLNFPLVHTKYLARDNGIHSIYLGLEKDIPLILRNDDIYLLLAKTGNKVHFSQYDDLAPIPDKHAIPSFTAKEIVEKLDEYVIGQEEAKKKLALSTVRYIKRMNNPDTLLPEANLILLGPSGSGKTLLISCLEKILDIPHFSTKATGKSDVGLVGDSLASIFDRVAMRIDDKSPSCIIHIDEVDKILRESTQRESRGGLQQELIGYTDNATIITEINKGGVRESRAITTKNMLFILSGVFDGLEKITKERMGDKKIGFGAGDNKKVVSLQDVTPADLIKYGMEAELVGRFKCVGVLEPLTPEQKVKVLTEPKGALIKRYQNSFSLEGYAFSVDEQACHELVKAAPKETGARGVEALLNEIMEELEYDPEAFAKDKSIVLDTAYVNEFLKKTRGTKSL
jgi:ATP-dependent Clp protease ATP-binding subunit ClpX